MANGHPDAAEYALHRVWEEAAIVVERDNHAVATETLLLQMAVSSLFDKKAGKDFQKLITRLTDGSER